MSTEHAADPDVDPVEPSNGQMHPLKRRAIILGLAAAIWVLLVFAFDFSAYKSAIAIAAAYGLFRIGIAMIRPLALPIPDPPDPGELRKVKLKYRCGVCGTEVRMMVSNVEDPEPPRHCMEDMDLLTPIE